MKKSVILILCFLFAFYGEALELKVVEKTIEVEGKKSKIYALEPFGIMAKKGSNFDVVLRNQIDLPTSIHWHGLILPNDQDGVAFITQLPIYPGESQKYQFPLVQSGTYFMHAHYGLQEQKLLTAPLILLEGDEEGGIVVLLSDFSFKSPAQIMETLRTQNLTMKGEMDKPDIVEVNYDAFLANFNSINAPEIFKVEKGKTIRLRLINGASATNFWINTSLQVEAIAVDGNRIKPFTGDVFELSIAQRIDFLVKIPENGGTFPIYARGEGTTMQTGFILTTNDKTNLNLKATFTPQAEAIKNEQEGKLIALSPLPIKPIDRRLEVRLGGNMKTYVWTLNGQSWPEVTPLLVKKGQRVEMTFKNETTMSHPMHLHGHVFEVTALDGRKITGALRDTVLVTPNSTVTIEFDADNPGVWPLHCHLLYHLEAGMLTVLRYED